MKFIEIKNLCYKYPMENKLTLDNINLEINKGEFILLTGKSGSGKSTLGKALTGSVPNFYGGTIKGEILISGCSLKKVKEEERAKAITMVFQDPEKQLVMNKVHREIALGLQNIGIESSDIKRRVFESLQFLNILDLWERNIDTLSGGQKQKVSIASALSYAPSCIIFDEPTSQLDPSSAEETFNLVKKINKELGITIIVIEQRINKWFDEADKIYIMDEGKISFYGDRENFYKNVPHEYDIFMPSYLRFMKKLGEDMPPRDFREALIKVSENEDLKLKNPLKTVEKEKKEEIIKVHKMSFSYEDHKVIKDLELSVMGEDFLCIMGPNGAGKSTFLKCLMGFLNYKGSISVLNKEASKIKKEGILKYIGYVSQNPNDYITKETVYEELKFTLDNYKIKDEGIITEVLNKLELYECKDKNPRDLSGGQKQRVAIASILVIKPKIIILDEPTRGMDLEAKEKLGLILKKLQEDGSTIIIVTHDVEFSASFCNRFILMFNGEIIADGPKYKVLKDGIYYTTPINKLFRGINKPVFSLKDAEKLLSSGVK